MLMQFGFLMKQISYCLMMHYYREEKNFLQNAFQVHNICQLPNVLQWKTPFPPTTKEKKRREQTQKLEIATVPGHH